MRFVYFTDVFCPFCLGFSPVLKRLQQEYSHIPFQVFMGNVVPSPSTVQAFKKNYPGMAEVFSRLPESIRKETQAFVQGLEQGLDLPMHSPNPALAFVSMKTLAPGFELEQAEAFQHAFFAQLKDVCSTKVQYEVASRWGIDEASFLAALGDSWLKEQCVNEAESAEDIMGQQKLYPTLYLAQNNHTRMLVAQGCQSYDKVHFALEQALRQFSAT